MIGSRSSARRTEPTPGVPLQDRGHSSERYTVIALITFLTFWMRYVLADGSSYWLDELFAVEQYVLLPATLGDSLRELTQFSPHPPLHHLILYGWVELFGAGETATRTLSNLAVAAATVALHRLVARVHGRPAAHAVAIVLALAYGATYYALETRSYAQTILLAVLSSYALLHYLRALIAARGARRLAPGWPAVLFLMANTALLMTHYYNLFYWAAQAAFALIVVVRASQPGRRADRVPAVVTAFAAQLAILLVLWGKYVYGHLVGSAHGFATGSPENTPLAMIDSLTGLVFTLGPTPGWVIFGAILALTAWGTFAQRQPRAEGRGDLNRIAAYYSTWMILGPIGMAYLAFLGAGAERFASRYFIFIVPHLAVLGVLGARQGMTVLFRARSTGSVGDVVSGKRSFWLAATLVLTTVFVVPGTVQAISDFGDKSDSRGTAEDIVSLIEGNPDHDFVIYEASFRPVPLLNHYLRRMTAGEVEVAGILQRWEEEQSGDFMFERERAHKEIMEHDHLIVAFVHYSAHEFSRAQRRFEEHFGEGLAVLDRGGRGIIVYDVVSEG